MSYLIKFSSASLLLLAAYLLLWPVPVSPVAWQAPPPAEYTGEFSVNAKLANFTAIELDGLHGPEAALVTPAGLLIASSHEGWLLRGEANAKKLKRWVDLGGRPLGLDVDAEGDIWVANAYTGLTRVTADGVARVELSEVEDITVRYADDVVVAPNGKIYFSDASTKFAAQEWGGTLQASLLDLMEHGGYGRIIEYDPAQKISRVIMRDLQFANGVTVDPQGRFLLVAETGAYRVWKYWLSGPQQGSAEVLIENLPGFPDNVHRGQDGRYWIGLTAPRSTALDKLSDKPLMRKVVQRLPAFMRPKVVPYGMVLAIDENGKVLHNLQAPDGQAYATTGAAENDNYLFVTSLTMPVLARYDKKKILKAN